MYLEGIALGGFRSFGSKMQRIGPLKKINFFIGQNNAGKSNILTFLNSKLKAALDCINKNHDSSKLLNETIERHKTGEKVAFQFGIGIKRDKSSLKLSQPIKSAKNILTQRKVINPDAIDKVLDSITTNNEIAWFDFEENMDTNRVEYSSTSANTAYRKGLLNRNEWAQLQDALFNMRQGDHIEWVKKILKELSPIKQFTVDIELISAFRRVEASQKEVSVFDGAGIIDKLAELSNPDLEFIQEKEKFKKINSFLQTVLENKNVEISIPSNKSKILVDFNDITLPLDSLGTGVQEVIIIAAASTILEEQIILIEEPEIHLHPLLQRKLIRYLKDNTSNQYFIATHSTHILDTPEATIFHIKLNEGQSVIDVAITDSEKLQICNDLGYRATDILQANCIIWVEGPSDRIYLNHWLHQRNPSFIEGIHYAIMFYGGRLLSHLSADETEIEEFISLQKLNRNMCIVIDSDRKNSRSSINTTKERIIQEFSTNHGIVWLTNGREIENYSNPEIVEQCIKNIHSNARCLVGKGQYDCYTDYHIKNTKDKIGKANKIRLAKEMTNHSSTFDMMDLEEKIDSIINFINQSNPD